MKKNGRILFIALVVSFVATYLFTRFVVSPKYESQAIIYPANFIPVSDESPTEQAVQMLNAGDIRNKVIDSFNLVEHYNLGEKYSITWLNELYNKHVTIEPTLYSSIIISVVDNDPELAANMANAIVELLNVKMLANKREKFAEWTTIYKKKYETKKARIQNLQKELTQLRVSKGVLNFEEQSAALITNINSLELKLQKAKERIEFFKSNSVVGRKDSIARYEIVERNAGSRLVELKPVFDSMLLVGDKIAGIQNMVELELESLADYKAEYEQALLNEEREITYSYEITKAGVSDQPAYPKKLFTSVLTSLSLTFALALALILLQLKNEIAKRA
ncbi:MAG: hypothetical protein KDC92_09820 [Bacteroidetes bacterium]|nr:hypothetical protein [Bacteroidota bacterium]